MAQLTKDEIIDDLLNQMYHASKSGQLIEVSKYLTKSNVVDMDYLYHSDRIIEILENDGLIEKQPKNTNKTLTHKGKSIVESGGWIEYQRLSSAGRFQRIKRVIVDNIIPIIMAIIVGVIATVLGTVILHRYFDIG